MKLLALVCEPGRIGLVGGQQGRCREAKRGALEGFAERGGARGGRKQPGGESQRHRQQRSGNQKPRQPRGRAAPGMPRGSAQMEQTLDAPAQFGAETESRHAQAAGLGRAGEEFAQRDETFGESRRAIVEQQAGFIGRRLAGRSQLAPRPPGARMPPEERGDEIGEQHPHGVERRDVGQFVREHRLLLLHSESSTEIARNSHCRPEDAEGDGAGKSCDRLHSNMTADAETAAKRLQARRQIAGVQRSLASKPEEPQRAEAAPHTDPNEPSQRQQRQPPGKSRAQVLLQVSRGCDTSIGSVRHRGEGLGTVAAHRSRDDKCARRRRGRRRRSQMLEERVSQAGEFRQHERGQCDEAHAPGHALAGRRTNQPRQQRRQREDQNDFESERRKHPRPRSKGQLGKHG